MDATSKLKEKDKIVTVAFDEMAVSNHLDYSTVCDYIDGFEDLGNKRMPKFASHGLVFMIRGVNRAFKQPFAYFCTVNLQSTELAELIKLVIEAIMDTGLKVIGTVCDATNVNGAAINILRGFRGQQWAGQLLQYKIRNVIITHVFDPPHLLKSTRNNLLTKYLQHYLARNKNKSNVDKSYMSKWITNNSKQQVASWKDVTDFFDYNKQGTVQLLRKITDEHMKPIGRKKMKVDLAAQVFSATYSNTMYFCCERNQLDRDYTGTADALLFFNDLFDSLNGDGEIIKNSLQGSIDKSSDHFKFWDYAIEMLQKMKYVSPDPKKKERSRVLNDWISTIKGLKELTNQLLRHNLKKVSLRRTTQDALEIFFGGIRGYCHSGRGTTIRDFKNAYGISIFNNISSRHSIHSNCKADRDKPLLQNLYSFYSMQDISCTVDVCEAEQSDKDNSENCDIEVLEMKDLSFAEAQATNFCCADVCKKLLKFVNCLNCRKEIETDEHSTEHNFVLDFGNSSEDLLHYPTEAIREIFKIIMFKLDHLVPDSCSVKNIKKNLIAGTEFEYLQIGCNEHKTSLTQKLVEITIELYIFKFTQRVNNILSGKTLKQDSNCKIEAAAIETRKKKMKKPEDVKEDQEDKRLS